MRATSTLEQMLNICVMSSTLMVGLFYPVMCRVNVHEDPECWQHRAYSVIIVDTRSCIRRCLRRQSVLEWGRVCTILNQNSSADRLGLNPAGLTKWEKH